MNRFDRSTENNQERLYWLFTISIAILIFVPWIGSQGMFLDGLTYATISRNLSLGIGQIWIPHYTSTLYPVFYEHPPLAFYLQSKVFDLLGDVHYVERLYSFVCFSITGLGIVLIWKELTNTSGRGWLAIIIWMTIPQTIWSYRNNMLENTLTLFCVFAVWALVKFAKTKGILYIVLAATLIHLALWSKGVVGLFPLISLALCGLAYRHISWRLVSLGTLVLVVILAAELSLFLISVPEAYQNLLSYFEQQLLPSIMNKREVTVNSHFSILIKLFERMLLPIILILLVIIWKGLPKLIDKRTTVLTLGIALSAVFPLTLTLKQHAHYLLPSLPFFSLWFASMIQTLLKKEIELLIAINRKIVGTTLVVVLLINVLLTVHFWNRDLRDHELLEDIRTVSQLIPKGSTIQVNEKIWKDWRLHAYLARMHRLSLDKDHAHNYFIIETLDQQTDHSILVAELDKYYLMFRQVDSTLPEIH